MQHIYVQEEHPWVFCPDAVLANSKHPEDNNNFKHEYTSTVMLYNQSLNSAIIPLYSYLSILIPDEFCIFYFECITLEALNCVICMCFHLCLLLYVCYYVLSPLIVIIFERNKNKVFFNRKICVFFSYFSDEFKWL